MRVHLGGAESIGQSRAAGLEFESVVRARAEPCVESPSRMTSQCSEPSLFGDQIGIADRSGIGVASSRSRLSRLESEGVEREAESHGGPGDRRHEEGLPRRMFESKRVVFANSGARIAAIASPLPAPPFKHCIIHTTLGYVRADLANARLPNRRGCRKAMFR